MRSIVSNTTFKGPDKAFHGHSVVRTHRGVVLLRYWIHVLAILATGAAATLNFLNVFLMDSDDENAIAKIAAFQFVAKLHEAIMLGSVSLAMIDYIRQGLLSADGMPLGYVLSPVMYNNIDWLLSASFWTNRPTNRQILSHSFNSRSSVPPFLVIVLAIVFANVAGPMSAVAIVPRLGWSNSDVADMFPAFWNISASAFRPETMEATALSRECSSVGAASIGGCPAYGSKAVANLWSFSRGPGVICTTTGFQSSCNGSMSSDSAANAIIRSLSLDFALDNLDAYATTPNAAIYDPIGFRFQGGVAHPFHIANTRSFEAGSSVLLDLRFAGSSGMFKPAVATSCRELQYDQIADLYRAENISTNWSTPTVTWLRDSQGSGSESFIFSYRIDSSELDSTTKCSEQECYAAIACSIDARWIPYSLWYNTVQPSLLFQSSPQPRQIFRDLKPLENQVPLSKDWLELTSVTNDTDLADNIVFLLNDWNVPRVRSPPQSPSGPLQENIGPTNHSVAVGIILAATITEAMANGPVGVGDSIYNGNCSDTVPGFRFSDEICSQEPTIWVHADQLPEVVGQGYSMISFAMRRAGWGWFWQDSLALQISLGALLLHGLLTACYVVYTLIFTRTITTRWASATELLILAIDSFRAPTLANSSIRARDSKIWLEPVTIREVEYGDRVSLIVGDGGAYPERVGGPPELGKKYL
jgi:hypothetical protein